ncbi:MAG: AbrB/MazE/SpoVT family DNA-binding domain-containing protein [Chloroflexota bacterium]|nr:MAG: AbrB/MazE/SpoVT family DNA-binding domain-containing protein [Chloroflexota bacterium]
METTIDRAGRIVIPKPMRDQAGLTPGTPLEITFDDGKIEIEAVPLPVRLVQMGRFLVAVPDGDVPALTSEDVERIRQDIYIEREKRILGQ